MTLRPMTIEQGDKPALSVRFQYNSAIVLSRLLNFSMWVKSRQYTLAIIQILSHKIDYVAQRLNWLSNPIAHFLYVESRFLVRITLFDLYSVLTRVG
jgi:hypothetical protein